MLYETPEGRVAPAGGKVKYVFYNFETKQKTEYTDEEKLNVPILLCVQQFSSRCEDEEDEDCVRCGKRKNDFWEDTMGKLRSYLTEPLPWAN